jgi:hypothetical protein
MSNVITPSIPGPRHFDDELPTDRACTEAHARAAGATSAPPAPPDPPVTTNDPLVRALAARRLGENHKAPRACEEDPLPASAAAMRPYLRLGELLAKAKGTVDPAYVDHALAALGVPKSARFTRVDVAHATVGDVMAFRGGARAVVSDTRTLTTCDRDRLEHTQPDLHAVLAWPRVRAISLDASWTPGGVERRVAYQNADTGEWAWRDAAGTVAVGARPFGMDIDGVLRPAAGRQ